MATDEMYLDNLEEWIFEDGRIVTYHTLSNDLQVPVDVAKEAKSVNVLYLVSGMDANNVYRVKLVPTKELESSLNPIFSVHIYSLQKALPSDSAALWSTVHDNILQLQKQDPYQNCFVTNNIGFVDGDEGAENREGLEKGQLCYTSKINDSYAADVSKSEQARLERKSSNGKESVKEKPKPRVLKGKAEPAKRGNLTSFFQAKKEPLKEEKMMVESEEEVPKTKEKPIKEEPKNGGAKEKPVKKESPKKEKKEIKKQEVTKEAAKKQATKKESPKKGQQKKEPAKKKESPKRPQKKASPKKETRRKKFLMDSSDSDSDSDDKEKSKKAADSEDSELSELSSLKGPGHHSDDESLSEKDFDLKSTKKVRSRLKRKGKSTSLSASSSSSEDPDADIYDDSEDEEDPKRKKKGPGKAVVQKQPTKRGQAPVKSTQAPAKGGRKKTSPAKQQPEPSDNKAKGTQQKAPRKTRAKKEEPKEDVGDAEEDPKKVKKSRPRKRKRDEVEEEIDEEEQKKAEETKRKFQSYFNKPATTESSSTPTAMKKEIQTTERLNEKGYLVLEDTVNFVPDKESEKRLEKERLKKEKKKEAEEPAAKRRRVGEGPKKQGSITSFFRTSAK